MPQEPDARYALRVRESVMERMRVMAKRNKRSLNREIELAIEQYLEREERDQKR